MINPNSFQIVFGNNDNKHELDIIKSPTKYEIIKLLKNSEMSFEEIVQNTSKTKSTVSMHLKSLREEGIVKYEPDPSDNRKKIFYLNTDVVANVHASTAVHIKENQTKLMIEDFIEMGDVNYTLMLIHAFKSILEEFGIELEYIINSLGKYIGTYLFNELYDEDFNVFTENIAEYWKDNNMGIVFFKIEDSIKIICKECFECMNLVKSGKPVCFLQQGMFETLLSNFFKLDINIIEVKCYSMGDEECVFEVEL